MNSRERVTTILNKKTPDRMGITESIWPETFPKWVEQGYPTDEETGKPLPAGDVFGYDFTGVWLSFDRWPRKGVNEIVEEDDESRLVRNGAGAVLRFWKHKCGTPEHVDFELTSREKWDAIKAPLLELDPERVPHAEGMGKQIAAQKKTDKFVMVSQGYVLEAMRQSLGDFCMFENFLGDPGWIRDFVAIYTDFHIRHFRYAFEQGGKPDGFMIMDDLGYTNGLWAAPEVMDDLIFPAHRAAVEFLHSEGVFALLHTCGDVRRGIDIIVDCGYDLLQPMEAKVGNNVLDYADRFGDRISFMGNIDAMILETGDRDLIRKEIEGKLIPLRDKGVPYVFHSDHSISPQVTYDAYRFAVDVYRELAEY